MLVLIDESGDCGLKFEKGSSEFFTCTAVVFLDELSASACNRNIDSLCVALKWPVGSEFHFARCSDRVRKAFLQTVVSDNFLYASIVVNKKRLYGDRFKNPGEFYDFSVGIACEQIRPLLDDSKIIIDRSGDREFGRRLGKSLKSKMTDSDGTRRIKKVVMERSHSNNLIQLADMVCGAVNRSFSARDPEFRNQIKPREKFVQIWPVE
jgi:hypothetical protein